MTAARSARRLESKDPQPNEPADDRADQHDRTARARAGDSEPSVPRHQRWTLLIYRVPSEPSRLRAALWRKLKSYGAIYLQSAVVALPETPESERALRRLHNQIIDEMGGTAILLTAEALAGESEIVGHFNAARNDEYEEIVDRCEDFLAQVEKEIVNEHFTFAELEENEEDLVKLRRWFDKVHQRDLLGAGGVDRTRQSLKACEQALESYAERVYEIDSERLNH